MLDELFWEVHSGLTREGPGDEGSLRRALSLMKALPAAPDLLDIGCGPGAQSLALAELTAGHVTSVDTHQPFLDRLAAAAAQRGLAERITTLNAPMQALPLEDGRFDAIWSEGAIYLMGLEAGLTAWRRLLRPGGFIAVSHICWLKPPSEVPDGARSLWADYPEMTDVAGVLAAVPACGYRALGHFVLPPAAWRAYYEPIQARIDRLRAKHRDDASIQAGLDVHQAEIDGYRDFGDAYGYLFVVMRAP